MIKNLRSAGRLCEVKIVILLCYQTVLKNVFPVRFVSLPGEAQNDKMNSFDVTKLVT